MMKLYAVLLPALCLGLAGCERAGDSDDGPTGAPAAESSVTALVGATLIDGTGAAPVSDAVVLVDGTDITAAGAVPTWRSPKAPAGSTSPASGSCPG